MRAYAGTRRIAKTHVPRLKFPAPATVETWVADAAGDPLLVVMAQPAASLAGELRRLIPELRAMVGDERRVLVGFDRGGWSPALFADLHTAGFDKQSVDFVDLHLGDGEALLHRTVTQPAGEECLARTVAPRRAEQEQSASVGAAIAAVATGDDAAAGRRRGLQVYGDSA